MMYPYLQRFPTWTHVNGAEDMQLRITKGAEPDLNSHSSRNENKTQQRRQKIGGSEGGESESRQCSSTNNGSICHRQSRDRKYRFTYDWSERRAHLNLPTTTAVVVVARVHVCESTCVNLTGGPNGGRSMWRQTGPV